MNGGSHGGFFLNQSLNDTVKSFRIVGRGRRKSYVKKRFPRIRRSVYLKEDDPTFNTVGPIMLLLLAMPYLFFLGFIYKGIPAVIVLAAIIVYLTLRGKKRKASTDSSEPPILCRRGQEGGVR